MLHSHDVVLQYESLCVDLATYTQAIYLPTLNGFVRLNPVDLVGLYSILKTWAWITSFKFRQLSLMGLFFN